MPQALHVQRFHIDHILAKKHVADERLDNLALACFRCNGYKGTDLSGIDPATGLLTRLFHPRQDRWSDHFRLEDGFILGVTDIGRVTVHVLNLNERSSVQLRRALIRRNLY